MLTYATQNQAQFWLWNSPTTAETLDTGMETTKFSEPFLLCCHQVECPGAIHSMEIQPWNTSSLGRFPHHGGKC